jgi:hypothetical protein
LETLIWMMGLSYDIIGLIYLFCDTDTQCQMRLVSKSFLKVSQRQDDMIYRNATIQHIHDFDMCPCCDNYDEYSLIHPITKQIIGYQILDYYRYYQVWLYVNGIRKSKVYLAVMDEKEYERIIKFSCLRFNERLRDDFRKRYFNF